MNGGRWHYEAASRFGGLSVTVFNDNGSLLSETGAKLKLNFGNDEDDPETVSSQNPDLHALEERLTRLEHRVEELTERLARLEAGETTAPPGTSVERAAPAEGRPDEPTVGALTPRRWTHRLPRLDWEGLIGGQGALWVGSAAIFLAVAFFLAYAWQFLGPLGRVLAGFLLGLALMAMGALSRKRSRHWFGVGLLGAGLAVLYLNTWAAYSGSGLFGGEAAFAIVSAITIAGVLLAVRLGAASLVSLATLGGFVTPIVAGPGPEALSLLVYVALLNTGIVATSLFKHWKLPLWLSFGGTTFTQFLLWIVVDLSALEALAFSTLYFAQFFGAACVYSLRRHEPTPVDDLFLPCLAAAVYAVLGFGMGQSLMQPFPAAFPLALAACFGWAAQVAYRRVPANLPFRNVCTALALFFLTIAAPLQLGIGWVAVAWAAEATLLETVGLRFGSPVFRRMSHLVLGLYAWNMVAVLLPFPSPYSWSLRTMTLGAGVLAVTWLAYWTDRWKPASRAMTAYAWLAVFGWAAWSLHDLLSLGGWSSWRIPVLLAAGLWGVIGGVAFRLGVMRELRPPREAGIFLVVLALIVALLVGTTGEARPLLNVRFLAYVLLIGALGSMAAVRARLPEGESRWLAAVPPVTALLRIWALTLEIFSAFQHAGIPDWERPAQLGVSLWWTLSGALLLGFGVRRRRRGFRLLGLGVLGLAALKVFLFDLASLDTPLRILSFGGLGLVLLGISWLYSRFGQHRDSA